MLRDSDTAGNGCKNDMECAKTNLQRALALDDVYMPALNQLAIYYFQQAKKRAGEAQVHRRTCRRTPRWQAGRRAAARARGVRVLAGRPQEPLVRADPQHRGPHPERARAGQRRGRRVRYGVKARPEVLRGADELRRGQPPLPRLRAGTGGVQQGARDAPERLRRAPRSRARATRPDQRLELRHASRRGPGGARHLQEARRRIVRTSSTTRGSSRRSTRRRSGGDKDKTIASLTQAKTIFQSFVDKAQGKDEYNGAVKRATERMKDIDDTIAFLQLPGGNTPPPPAATPAAPDAAAPAPAAGATPAPAPGAAPASPAPLPRRRLLRPVPRPPRRLPREGTRTDQSSRCQEPRARGIVQREQRAKSAVWVNGV